MSVLSKPYFHDEEAAHAHLEGVLWPNGPVCPHCFEKVRISKIKANPAKRIRYGLYKCGACKRQFTVKIGTVFEHGRIPLHKFLQAVHLLCSSKKGISAHQLHRVLEVQYKTAWFLAHRIREAMRSGDLSPMGGPQGIVEADETFIGRLEGMPKPDRRGKRGGGGAQSYKNTILTLVERGGKARSFHIESTTVAQIVPIVRANIKRESRLMTDEARHYVQVGKWFAEHGSVEHSRDEYVRGDVHSNTVEGYYSIFKRGMKGVYQHCSEKHLHRYLAEFDFRYNNRSALGVEDQERSGNALAGMKGKRLTYRGTDRQA
ncbi:MAG TPA: IS1595 family transposase [Hyphomonadaceae bacterium]|nr:IS1595 family transposase [Hyphomonadaceae bacterium]